MEHNPYQPPVPEAHPPSAQATAEPHPSVSVIASIRFAFSAQVGFAKLALALLLTLIPVVGPIALAGWMAETHRRLARRESPSVRGFELNESVNYLMAGLVPFVAQLVASLIAMIPMLVVIGILAAVLIPVLQSGSTVSPWVIIVVAGICGVLALAAMAATVLYLTAALVRAELTGSFARTFDLPSLRDFVKRQWKPILSHSLVMALLSIPMLLLGLVVFLIGIYFVSAALQFAQLHLRWQIYESDVRQGGEPLPIFPGNGADF